MVAEWGWNSNSGRRKMSGDVWWWLSRYTRGLTAPSLPLKMTINIQHNPDTYGSRNISEDGLEEDACWEIVFSRLDRDAVLKKYQQNGSREANVL